MTASRRQRDRDGLGEPLLRTEDSSGPEHRVDIHRVSVNRRSSLDEGEEHDGHHRSTPGGTIRLRRTSVAQEAHVSEQHEHHGDAAAAGPATTAAGALAASGGGAASQSSGDMALALKEPEGEGSDRDDGMRELEVEVLTEAVAEAVAEAVNEVVQEAVTEAVHDAVAQAIEENVNFDVRANIYTLVAVTGVILYWRGVWNTWDYVFGLSLWSELACIATGLTIMLGVRLTNVPLAQGLPGG